MFISRDLNKFFCEVRRTDQCSLIWNLAKIWGYCQIFFNFLCKIVLQSKFLTKMAAKNSQSNRPSLSLNEVIAPLTGSQYRKLPNKHPLPNRPLLPNKRPLYGLNILLDALSLINAPCLIDWELIQNIGLIIKACVFHLVQCQVLRKDRLTMATQ